MSMNKACRRFLRWWLGELAGSFPPRLLALVKQARNPGLIVMRNAGIFVAGRNWQLPEDGEAIPIGERSAEDISEAIRACARNRQLDRRDVQIAVGSEGIFDVMIELPLAAASNVPAVLNAEIDRHTPFSFASSYHDFRVLDASEENQTIAVRLKAVPRQNIDIVISAVKKAGLSPVRVCAEDDLLKLDRFEFQPPGLERRSVRRSAARYVLLALLSAALVVASIYLPVYQARKANVLLDEQLADMGRRLKASEQSGERVRDALDGLMSVVDLRREAPPVILLLNEISKVLPDHSYARQLRLDRNSIEVSGLTENANDIIRVFDRSKILSNARFPAPVKRAGLSNMDEFHLVLEVGGAEK